MDGGTNSGPSLHGEGLSLEGDEAPEKSNVIDLMSALKKSLGQVPGAATPVKPAAKQSKPKAKKPVRKQPGLILPIKGGRPAKEVAPVPMEAKSAWKRN